ncbi:protein spinster homolog 3-like [Scyliorhinus canicula]|uniref:protein spinster homolog 3-like n=1 Tax=Scyliorhinus canicula TaxID=7830 RepID=UPI0018F362B0|nr:protein spinster homolog 3-like [Scyliorhinus canicula]
MEGASDAQPRERSATARYGSTGSLGAEAEADNVQVNGTGHFYISPTRSYIVTFILFLINLLNYMDRFIIAGVLGDIQDYFKINDTLAGLLQTVFICSYMILAPLFGYLGDRYDRKMLMSIGIFIWCGVTLAGSFTTPSYFWALVLCRALVGIGEASYSTIAPTIIADLFVGDKRTIMISIFYIAIPVGSGLGYILGSGVMKLTGDWHWSMRVTPCVGFLVFLFLIFFVPNPSRGASEDHTDSPSSRTSWREDLKYLCTNRSFVLSSFGTASVSFTTGALGFWTPVFLLRARNINNFTEHTTNSSHDSLIFGAITCVTGIVGIGIGAMTSKYLKKKIPEADPLICAVGMLSSSPCLFIAIVLAKHSIALTYFFIFLAEIFLALNWAIVADILLYIIIPTRRSMAEAVQITICHVLGDASSSYIIGAISDTIRRSQPASSYWSFVSLEYAFLLCPFIAVVGGALFLWTARYLEEDRKKASQQIRDPAEVTCAQRT